MRNQKTIGLLCERVDQALGSTPADLVIKDVTILSVADGSLHLGDIAINGGTIVGVYDNYKGQKEIDGTGLTAVPGFIDTHVHVESSLIRPEEFDRLVLPLGTTTAMCDPHEISNVMGEKGLKYFLDASMNLAMDMFVQLSSCVPASPLETAGAHLSAQTLARYKNHPRTTGLAEFMDIGGVLRKDPKVLAKLAAFQDRHIDGHLPGVTGFALNAMMACGVRNCHESTDLLQATEKLRKGLIVLIREGTICKDLPKLISLIEPYAAARLSFCTDDRKPTDIVREGHIDHLVRSAIAQGADPACVYRIASLSAAEGFGLRDRGIIAPGRKADIVLLSDYRSCTIHSVIKNGEVVTDDTFARRPITEPVGYNSVKLQPVTEADFIVPPRAGLTDVIGLLENQIVTTHLQRTLPVNEHGERQVDLNNDILKMVVFERHGINGNVGRGFIKGFGIKDGAIASTHGHDSHNLTVIGSNDRDMALAVNHAIKMQGGFVVVQNGRVTGKLALPIAGLMSDGSYEGVVRGQLVLDHALANLKVQIPNPILYLAFMPLCVIPTLRVTDFGITRFDPSIGDQGPVLIDDQRRPAARRPRTARRTGPAAAVDA
jgi:adenine deaminase